MKMNLPDSAESIRRKLCSTIQVSAVDLHKTLSTARAAAEKEGVSKQEKLQLLTMIDKVSQLLEQMKTMSESLLVKRPKPNLHSV